MLASLLEVFSWVACRCRGRAALELEVIALRHLGVRVAAISCVTNLAAGISPTPLDHAEVQAIAVRTAAPFVALLSRFTALLGNELSA